MISSFCPVTPTAPHVCTDDLLKIAMADDEDPVAGLNPFPSATAAVGSEQRASSVPYHPSATTSEAYFNDPAPDMPEENFQTTCNIENQTTCHGNGNTMPTIENNQANPPSAMWASFLRAMAEGFRANETSSTTPKTVLKKMKPSDVYIPSFDPDDCEFTAAQWCEEIDHHRTQNEWTDYETRNAAFTHLRGRARKWASKSYPLCKTWVEAKERLTRQFATTKRFHDLFRDMVQYTSDKAATYVEYSTSKLAMIDRLEPGWSEANKIEVVISGIVDNQVRSDLLKNTPTDFVALDRHLGTYCKIRNLKRTSTSNSVPSEQKIRRADSDERSNVVCHNCGRVGHYKRNCKSEAQAHIHSGERSTNGEASSRPDIKPCPEKNIQCSYCNKVGHTENVCFTKQRDAKNKQTTKSVR